VRRAFLLALPLAVVLGVAAAIAYYSSAGAGSATAGVGGLGAPTISSATAGAGTVALSWSTVSPPSGGSVTYYVSHDGGPAGGNCPTAAAPSAVTSCIDSGLSAGTYHYTVIAVWQSWTGTSATQNITVASGALDHFLVEAAGGGDIGTQVAGTTFNVEIVAQDSADNTVTSYTGTVDLTSNRTCSVGCSETAVFNAGVRSNTPMKLTQAGTGATITATDHGGTKTGTSNAFTVNQAPAITSSNSATLTVGSGGSFTVTTTGYPTDTITNANFSGCTKNTLPSGVSFTDNGNNTATLAGTPAAGTGGTYTLCINASNGVGSAATQTFALTVNQAPAITSSNSTGFTVGSSGSFTITSTGFPAPTLSKTGTLPSGVTFNSSTGALSGTPAAGTAATYPIVITAANGVGTNATQNFTLTVNPIAAAKLAFTTLPQTFEAGTTTGTTGSGTITVQLQSASGNPVAAVTNTSVTLTRTGTTGTFSPASPVTIPAGRSSVSFTYNDTTAGTSQITAASSGLTSASQTENVLTPGSGWTLGVGSQSPSPVTAGGSATVPVTVTLPSSGQPQTHDFSVTGLNNGLPSGAAGSVASNCRTATGHNGTASFSLSVSTSTTTPNGTSSLAVVVTEWATTNGTCGGAGNTLQATGSLAVTGVATQLAFTQQPTSTAHGSTITPAVTVSVEDSSFNVVTTSTASVTLAIVSNPSGGTLSGTLTKSASSGVATFSNLSINTAGAGYTLGASSSGLTGAVSASFNVT
jgi:hypothetical protein